MLTGYWVFGRQLTTGKLMDLGVTDGSNLTLFPVIEAGLVVSKLVQMLRWRKYKTFSRTPPYAKKKGI